MRKNVINSEGEEIKRIEKIKSDLTKHTEGITKKFIDNSTQAKIIDEGKFKIAKMDEIYLNLSIDSLNLALREKEMEFTDDNMLDDGIQEIPLGLLETIQRLSKANEITFLEFKEKSRNKTYAPISVCEDKKLGFYAKAILDIPESTLICEYAGLVQNFDRRVMKNNDDIMEYVSWAEVELVINPQNMAIWHALFLE